MAVLILTWLVACDCPPQTPAQRLVEAEVIFRGELSNLSEDAEGSCSGRGSWNFSMLVHAVYKGKVDQRVNVRSVAPSADDCGIPVTRDGEFLVFAQKAGNFREYRSDACMGTMPIDEADAELALLGPGSPPGEVGCVSLPIVDHAWLLGLAAAVAWRSRRRARPTVTTDPATVAAAAASACRRNDSSRRLLLDPVRAIAKSTATR